MLNYIFEFMTFAFPKAGAQIGVPFTIAIFLFLFALLKCQYQVIPGFMQVKGLAFSYTLFVSVVLVSLLFNLGNFPVFQLATVMMVIASPLAIGIGRSLNPQTALKILAISLVIVGVYALIQRIVGIVTTSIPGVTYTFGQDLAAKPIGYGMAASGEAQKMPSTYQNGNGAGLFYAMGIPILLAWSPSSAKQKVLKIVAILFGCVGLLLSGSRSIMIPFVLFLIVLLVLVKNKLNYRNQILFFSSLMFIATLGIVYLLQSDNQFLQQLYTRYINQTLSDPTGAGRTSQFVAAFTQINGLDELGFLRFLCVGLPWDQVGVLEGFVSILFNYGLFGFIGFLFVLAAAIYGIYERNKLASIGFICVFIAFIVDGSFNFPPTLMNFFFLTGLLTQPGLQETSHNSKTVPSNGGTPFSLQEKKV
ncbi:O-antigen ligase family protein [Sporolactobacillus laevolacticus]|uniref:Uncharacterized protein n=1 Tax=Sporolactobacillus laevolacticus DSM 442 TaxID=1395513 RepID=V6IZ70_9BACL|nr:hypothetical protein [Sporolactobacillus laevolacticus]EST12782.1 hypothetical protein P343_06295 [Sporolactobacillus laevolacticus DSM 442]